MKKTIKILSVIAFVIAFSTVKAQFGLGEQMGGNGINNHFPNSKHAKAVLTYNDDGAIIEYKVHLDEVDIDFISTSAQKNSYCITSVGEMFTVCDKIIYTSSDENNFNSILNDVKSDYKKIGDNKWSYDDKEYGIKSTVELVTNNNVKSLIIKGNIYAPKGYRFTKGN